MRPYPWLVDYLNARLPELEGLRDTPKGLEKARSLWPQALNLTVGALALIGALAGIVGRRIGLGLGGVKLPEENRNLGRLSQELTKGSGFGWRPK